MRVLLFGGSGLLGSELLATAPVGWTVAAPASSDVDIADHDQVARVVADFAPAWVVNAAAYTAVDVAESDPGLAVRVNAEGPAVIARACMHRGARVAHFSTDYVFSGSASSPYAEDDATGPLNVYGRTKLVGEQALLRSGVGALIIRTAWLYGTGGTSFVKTMIERAVAGQKTRVVQDQVGRPTRAVDLAGATWALLGQGATGMVHATSVGPPASWFDVARRIFESFGSGGALTPCSTRGFPSAAARPAYSVLSTARLARMLGRELPDWRDALDEHIALVRGRRASPFGADRPTIR